MTGKKIIVAYDGSPDSDKALKLAVALAKALGADIDLVTVVEASSMISTEVRNYEAQKAMIKQGGEAHLAMGLKKAAELGVQANGIVLEGNTPEQIIKYAETAAASLIVVGTRGLGGFAQLMLGSVARALVKHSGISVVVAK